MTSGNTLNPLSVKLLLPSINPTVLFGRGPNAPIGRAWGPMSGVNTNLAWEIGPILRYLRLPGWGCWWWGISLRRDKRKRPYCLRGPGWALSPVPLQWVTIYIRLWPTFIHPVLSLRTARTKTRLFRDGFWRMWGSTLLTTLFSEVARSSAYKTSPFLPSLFPPE